MTIEKGKIGVEDIEFGTVTFTRKGKSGTLIPISKVSAVNIPITDSGSKFTGTNIETALQECLVENSDGSSAKDYTNKSGSDRVAGDVVIVDIDNDESFELTTTLGDTKVLGVVAEAIANNAAGRVITNGYVTTVTVDGVTSRGSFLRTSATTGKASPSSTFVLGCFAIALKASVGPGVVSAFIFGSVSGNYLALTGGYLTGIVGTAKGANVVSANNMTVGDDGNYFEITGTTTINTIATKGIGTIIWLRFQDALTLTHSTDLVLPGSANYITIAGDILTFIEYQTGDWRCISLISAGSGITGTGKEVKQVSPTLTTPTLSVPIIADYTSGQHTHNNAAGGGQISTAGITEFTAQTAGDYLLVENTTARTVTTTTYAKYKETKVGVGGTYRIKFSMKANTSGTIYGQIYRNGVAVGTERSTTSTTITEFSEDIGGWSSGDLVQLYSKRTVDGFVSIFNIYTAAPPIGGGLYGY